MPDTFAAAAALLRLLYEREYGTHLREIERKEERERDDRAASLAATYQRGIRKIPLAPDYVPADTTPE